MVYLRANMNEHSPETTDLGHPSSMFQCGTNYVIFLEYQNKEKGKKITSRPFCIYQWKGRQVIEQLGNFIILRLHSFSLVEVSALLYILKDLPIGHTVIAHRGGQYLAIRETKD